MSANEFWLLKPCQFYAINHKFIEQIKYQQQNDWERTRWQTTWLINCHVKTPKKPQDLIKFDWETESKTTGLTKEKIEELKNKWGLNG